MQALFPGRDDLRILWGPNRLHQLSGAVTTPVFHHLGMSSWHAADGALMSLFKPGHALARLLGFLLTKSFLLFLVMVGLAAWYRGATRRRRRLSDPWEKGSRKEFV